MREIKFRAWDKEGKKLVFNYCEENKNEILLLMVNQSQLELMQYTGLKDKNGVEIYEGDIIQRTSNNKTRYKPAEVYWCDKYAQFKFKGDLDMSYNCFIDLKYINELEVIGNIYEYSHLLENK